MNSRLRFVAWLLLIAFTTSSHSLAGEKIKRTTTERNTTKRYTTTYRTYTYERRTYNADDVAADVIIARPAWFAETVVGGALFVLALPFAAASGTIHETAHALVGKPGRATFRRQPGDFSTIE
jgi:hypothetical protein